MPLFGCRRLADEVIAPERVVRVLEVGAGDGRLAHHLSAALGGMYYILPATPGRACVSDVEQTIAHHLFCS